MLHPIKPSCKEALNWAVDLQLDLLSALCAPDTLSEMVTPDWIAGVRPEYAEWLRRFTARKYHKKTIIEHMQSIAGLNADDKEIVLDHVKENLRFREAFVSEAGHPQIRFIDVIPTFESVRAMLEAFYELALHDGFPVDESGRRGGNFCRADYVHEHGLENSPRVCPFCDGEMDGAQVEHWMAKAKFPELSCHPNNLIPSCYRCNALEKGRTPPLDIHAAEPFKEWFHPYHRQANGRLKIIIQSPKVSFEATHPDDVNRIENYNRLFNLSNRWTDEYRHQEQDYQRTLRIRFRRQHISRRQFEKEILTLEEIAVDDLGEKPHAILQQAVLENVRCDPDTGSSWYEDLQASC